MSSLGTAGTWPSMAGELIVVDNNSTDRTAEIARASGAVLVFEPHNQIARARNAGARVARGRYFIFVDADTLLPAQTLRKALENLETGHIVGGGAVMRMDRPCGRIAMALVEFFLLLQRRFRWAAGSFVYCRRDAFEAIGGFDERLYASEEIRLSVQLSKWGRARGQTFEIIGDPGVITSARKMHGTGRILLALAQGLLLPFTIFSRRLCWLWYRR